MTSSTAVRQPQLVLLLAMLATSWLAACGGGGTSSAGTSDADAAGKTAVAADTSLAPTLLPAAYTLQIITPPTGRTPFTFPSTEDGQRVINSKGQVIAQEPIHSVFFDPAVGARVIAAEGEDFSIVSALNESGLVVGRSATTSGGSAYAWSQASGLRLLGEDDASLPTSEAVLVTEEGIVAGRAFDAQTRGFIFQWNPATSAVSTYSTFFALQAMNRHGTMLGFVAGGESTRRAASRP
jgi:hypothetical protein